MTCKHLKALYETCQRHQLKLGSSDLIRIVCRECGVEEVCPSVLCAEFEARHDSGAGATNQRGERRERTD